LQFALEIVETAREELRRVLGDHAATP
jgi:hypothetical protein